MKLVTIAVEVCLTRRCCACRTCGAGQVEFDAWAGVEKGHLTVGAKRMACVAATGWSFDQASKKLKELTGLAVSDQTIRRVAEAEGVKVWHWQDTSPAATAPVAAAPGNKEFLTDGTMVNTREGWQEVRLSIFSKRQPGAPVDPATFTGLEDRGLPKPSACLVLVDKCASDQLGPRWARTMKRLGWGRGEGVSALADGARWIASEEEKAMPEVERVVDVFHVSAHQHDCGAALHGDKTEPARAWAKAELVTLVRQGAAVAIWNLQRQAESEQRPAAHKELENLLEYLRPNQHALGYGERLRKGQPIGSGQVESACKTVIGRRLKLNSARWSPAHAAPFASLCSLDLADLWEPYWSTRAAA